MPVPCPLTPCVHITYIDIHYWYSRGARGQGTGIVWILPKKELITVSSTIK